MDESSDLREFIREMTLRVERAVQVMDRKTDVMAGELRELVTAVKVMQRKADLLAEEIGAQRADIRAENRAQREALFRMLDRLDNGGGAAPAT